MKNNLTTPPLLMSLPLSGLLFLDKKRRFKLAMPVKTLLVLKYILYACLYFHFSINAHYYSLLTSAYQTFITEIVMVKGKMKTEKKIQSSKYQFTFSLLVLNYYFNYSNESHLLISMPL